MAVKSPFSHKFTHVGIVVRDAERTAKRLEAMGMGPFENFSGSSLPPLDGPLLLHGKPYDGKHIMYMNDLTRERIEIFQPLGGRSPWQEFLDKNGEGIHHIGFAVVDDFAKAVARFTDNGVTVIHSAKQLNGGGSVYFDLGAGNILLELEKYEV